MHCRIAHLYPEHLNMYGDRGNVLTLVRRCQWRGIAVELKGFGPGQALDPDWADLYFMGGGQDLQQIRIAEDLQQQKAQGLQKAVAQGAVILAICGGYQLLGHYYRPHQGPELKGLGLLDAYTVAGHKRLIGNVALRRDDSTTLVGFENHSGKTYLGPDVSPLGHLLVGHGNNGEDGQEGAVFGNLYGSYLHGALLPKNPQLADELLLKALQKRDSSIQTLPDLSVSDTVETTAHQQVFRQLMRGVSCVR